MLLLYSKVHLIASAQRFKALSSLSNIISIITYIPTLDIVCPYKRYIAANNGCHLVNTYHEPSIGLSDLNALSYLTTTNETAHFTAEKF